MITANVSRQEMLGILNETQSNPKLLEEGRGVYIGIEARPGDAGSYVEIAFVYKPIRKDRTTDAEGNPTTPGPATESERTQIETTPHVFWDGLRPDQSCYLSEKVAESNATVPEGYPEC